MNAKQVLEIFPNKGIIDASQVEDIARRRSVRPARIWCRHSSITASSPKSNSIRRSPMRSAWSYVNLSGFEPPNEILRASSRRFGPAASRLSDRCEGNTLQVALADPLNPQTAEDLRFALGKEIQVVVAPVWQIEELIRKTLRDRCRPAWTRSSPSSAAAIEFGGPDATDRPQEPRGRGERHADHSVRRPGDVPGYSGSRLGHSLRAVRDASSRFVTASTARSTRWRRRRVISRCRSFPALRSWRT